MTGARVYAPADAMLILRVANHHQDRPVDVAEPVTLEGIRSLGERAGIERNRLDAAAATFDLSLNAESRAWLGPASRRAFTGEGPGAVDARLHAALHDTIRREIHRDGTASSYADTFGWSSDLHIVHLTVSPGDGRAQVRILLDAHWDLAAICVSVAALAAVGVWQAGRLVEVGPLHVVGASVVAYVGARAIWTAMARRSAAKMDRLKVALLAVARQHHSESDA